MTTDARTRVDAETLRRRVAQGDVVAPTGTATAAAWLRRTLVGLDALGLIVAWTTAAVTTSVDVGSVWLPLFTVAGVVIMRGQRLYRARIARSWSLETTRIARSAGLLGLLTLLVVPVPAELARSHALVLMIGTAATLTLGRLLFRGTVRVLRRNHLVSTPLVVVGHGEHAIDLVEALDGDPAGGFRVIGVIGPGWHRTDVAHPWLGTLDDALVAVEEVGLPGVVIESEGLPAGHLDGIADALVGLGAHVQLSMGLRTLHHRRLTPSSLSHQAMLYLEPANLSAYQRVAKRVLDVVLAALALILVAPLWALVAAAITLEDRGPVLFRQVRIGKDGRRFEVLKFRSMVPDAEERLAELQADNARSGPLFKLARDPRVTRVGRVIRATSLDEVPQFLNVLRGEMSLVGPRPALPDEHATFDDELAARGTVRPGITGLWQVEARDNASFDAYRRLDLVYLRNWSLGLDLTILAATPAVVVGRAIGSALRRTEGAIVPGVAVDAQLLD